MPASISASSVTTNSAYLYASWSGLTRPSAAIIECNGQQVAGWMYQAGAANNCGGSITGLTPDTLYSASVVVWDEGAYAASGSVNFRTSPAYVPPSKPGSGSISSVSLDGTNKKKAYIYFLKGSNAVNATVRIYNSSGSLIDYLNYANSPLTYEFPNYNTQYYVSLMCFDGNDVASDDSGWYSVSTGSSSPVVPGVPTVANATMSGKTATVYYTFGANTSYIKVELSNSNDTWTANFDVSSSPNAGTFPLYATNYRIRARGVSSTGDISGWSSYYSVTTGPDPNVPASANITGTTSDSANGKVVSTYFNMGPNTDNVTLRYYDSAQQLMITYLGITSSPHTHTFPSYNTLYNTVILAYKGSTLGTTSSMYSFYTGSPSASLPTIGSLIATNLTVEINYNIGAGNEHAEMEWYESSTGIQLMEATGNVRGTQVHYTFEKPNFTYKVRMRGVLTSSDSSDKSGWTGWGYVTTGSVLVTMTPPTLGTATFNQLMVYQPYSLGLNNQSVEFGIEGIQGYMASASTPWQYTFWEYNIVYRIRVRGVNVTSGVTTTSSWTDWKSITIPPPKPLPWSWDTSISQYKAVTTTRVGTSNVYNAYFITAVEWNSFTEKITKFLEFKNKVNDPGKVAFTSVSKEMAFTSSILNQAINNINLMLPEGSKLINPVTVTAKIFIDMKNAINSII